MSIKENTHLLLKKYVRRVPPVLTDELRNYILEELREIESVLSSNQDGVVETLNRLPNNPRIGMLKYFVNVEIANQDRTGLHVYTEDNEWRKVSLEAPY